jgi:hypothetical protein
MMFVLGNLTASSNDNRLALYEASGNGSNFATLLQFFNEKDEVLPD